MKTKMQRRALPVLLVLMVLTVFACGTSRSPWADGSYSGEGKGIHGAVKLAVEIRKGKIEQITILEEHETEGVSDLALEEIPRAVIEKQSVQVDGIAGASVTTGAILDAVRDALQKAEEAKGK